MTTFAGDSILTLQSTSLGPYTPGDPSHMSAGIATSLKILFHEGECADDEVKPQLILERNEVIALVNLFERLSKAIDIVRVMSLELLDRRNGSPHSPLGAIESVTESEPLFGNPFV